MYVGGPLLSYANFIYSVYKVALGILADPQHTPLHHFMHDWRCIVELTELRQQVGIAHDAMLTADHTYEDNPTHQHNQTVCRAQRAYYNALWRYCRAINVASHVLMVRRAIALRARAIQNRKRLPHDSTWQELTLHQYRRARNLCNRAHAMASMMPEAPQPIPTRSRPVKRKPAPRARTRHPITGRMVYTDSHDTQPT